MSKSLMIIKVGKQIKQLRGKRPAYKLAIKGGMSPQTWNDIENGKGNPTLKTLEQIGKALGVRVEVGFKKRGNASRKQGSA